MRRKHNLLTIMCCVAVLVGIVSLVFIGCTATADAADEAPRFVAESVKIGKGNGAIITDTETGDLYLWVQSGYGGGLAKMGTVED